MTIKEASELRKKAFVLSALKALGSTVIKHPWATLGAVGTTADLVGGAKAGANTAGRFKGIAMPPKGPTF